MRPDRNPAPFSAWRRWLPVLGAMLVLAVAGLAYLRARYGWGDMFRALDQIGGLLSRKRLAVLLVASGGIVWGAARWAHWRASARPAYLATLAYTAGVIADGIILLSLEPLGISLGPLLIPLALVAALRLALALGLSLLAWLSRRRMHRQALWPLLHVGGQALILLLVLDGFVLEPSHLTVSRLTVPDTHYAGTRPLRIVQISDLHIERANDLTRQIAATVRDLQPDLVVLTGDYLNTSFNSDPQAIADLRGLLGALQARQGVYAIRGNVDSPALARRIFQGLPITLLEDQWVTVETEGRRIVLAGVGIHHDSNWQRDLQLDRQALIGVLASLPRGDFTVLLYHTPDLAPEASAAGVDLFLAGHTHGGQVRLPFYGALTTLSLLGKRYEMGAYREGNTLIYISRGIGMEGWLMPRMRFLCPPEIVVFDVGN